VTHALSAAFIMLIVVSSIQPRNSKLNGDSSHTSLRVTR